MSNTEANSSPLEFTLAFWLLRIWLAVRAIFTGLEKYAANVSVPQVVDGFELNVEKKVYGLSHYQGVPDALSEKFAEEPLLPGFFLAPYEFLLGPLLMILGITLLIGVATRFTLFAMGLLYTSLTFGLILLKQDAGIAWLATHVIMIALALFLAKHNRYAVWNKF